MPAKLDLYFFAFLGRRLNIRDRCCDCPHRTVHAADMTLADFWGYRTQSQLPENETGLSLLLIHTEKGRAAAEAISGIFSYAPLDEATAIEASRKEAPTQEHAVARRAFLEAYARYGLEQAAIRAGMPTGLDRVKRRIKYAAKKQLYERKL